MDRTFKPFLELKISQVYYQGYTVFERWELLTMFNMEKITKTIWLEILEVWGTLSGNDVFDNANALAIIKCDDTSAPQKYVVVNKKTFVDINSLANLEPIEEYIEE